MFVHCPRRAAGTLLETVAYLPVCLLPEVVAAQSATTMSGVRRRRPATESSDDEEEEDEAHASPRPSLGTKAASAKSVAVAESRMKKIILRSTVGLVMVTSFVGIVWAGHLYLSALVVLIQVKFQGRGRRSIAASDRNGSN